VEYAENTDPTLAVVDPVVLGDTGWSTGPATGAGSVGDDGGADDHGTDDHENESGDD
jgi:hypothetical protein